MDESTWLEVNNYNTNMDQDFFDAYLVSEWIDSFELPSSRQVSTGNAMAEEEAAIFCDDDFANLDFANDREYLFASCDRIPETNPQPDSVSATTPLERFSAPVQLVFNASPRQPEKRRFEECLSEFVGLESVDKGTKRRKRYSTENRKKVDQVRKAGACIRCKLMKTPVSHLGLLLPRKINADPHSKCELELPCASCLKTCKDQALGRSLCIRQRLIDARFTIGTKSSPIRLCLLTSIYCRSLGSR
jgi:hypothetical protein